MTNVLLIDDEAPIADVLARSLRAHGNTVRVAFTAMDGLLALTEEVPDVILLDISLPDITGWELLRRLSPLDRQRVPVIAYSASPLAPARRLISSTGCRGWTIGRRVSSARSSRRTRSPPN